MKVLLLIVLLALTSCQQKEKPVIYIASLVQSINYEGRKIWLLEYALDGRIEQAIFYQSEVAQDYIEYLRSIGEIKGEAK